MTENPHKYFVSLPSGLRLMSESYFLEELKPFGITVKGFRSLLRALNVPSIEIGKVRLIDSLTFAMALKCVLRIGEPDFLVPGCESIRKNRTVGCALSLDPSRFEKNAKTVIAELLYARRFFGMRNSADIRTLARDAAARLVSFGMHNATSDLQEESSRRMLAQLDADFPELQEDS